VAADQPSKADEGLSSGELQYFVPQEVLDVHFPAAVRGYDRDAVDNYVKRVNRVIAELKVRGSPPAAVARLWFLQRKPWLSGGLLTVKDGLTCAP